MKSIITNSTKSSIRGCWSYVMTIFNKRERTTGENCDNQISNEYKIKWDCSQETATHGRTS